MGDGRTERDKGGIYTTSSRASKAFAAIREVHSIRTPKKRNVFVTPYPAIF